MWTVVSAAHVTGEPRPELISHLEQYACESNPHGKQHVLHSQHCIIPKWNDGVNSINKSPGNNSYILQLKANYYLKINNVVISFLTCSKQSPTMLMYLRTCHLLVNGHQFFPIVSLNHFTRTMTASAHKDWCLEIQLSKMDTTENYLNPRALRHL